MSLHQPYAQLIAEGAKRIETRSWNTSYRGPLAIHASKGLPPGGVDALIDLCETKPFRSALAGHRPSLLPRGAIVATCLLSDIVPAVDAATMLQVAVLNGDHDGRASRELAFGNYSPGRYAWLLECVARLEEPIPAKGALSLWEPEWTPELQLAVLQLNDVAQTGGLRCVRCGCTDNYACEDGCGWASADPPMCTSCAAQLATAEGVPS